MSLAEQILSERSRESASEPANQRGQDLQSRILAKALKNAATAETAADAARRIDLVIQLIDKRMSSGRPPASLESLKQDYLSLRDRAHSIVLKAGSKTSLDSIHPDEDAHHDTVDFADAHLPGDDHHHHETLDHLTADIHKANQRYDRGMLEEQSGMLFSNPTTMFGGSSRDNFGQNRDFLPLPSGRGAGRG